jgi:hypothetical protein
VGVGDERGSFGAAGAVVEEVEFNYWALATEEILCRQLGKVKFRGRETCPYHQFLFT